MPNPTLTFIRKLYPEQGMVPLHVPLFKGNESAYVQDTIASTFVSSVGAYVDQFENQIADYCQAKGAVAVVNGTSALQVALYSAGVTSGDIVITQSLTFVATCNAIHWLGAEPAFVDVSKKTLGLCPHSLEAFLSTYCELTSEGCIYTPTGQRIRAVVPMHTFGHPVEIDLLVALCKKWQLFVVEDAAESLGSTYQGRHTGTFGDFGALSFNGNKIITTGGGGVVLTSSSEKAQAVKHITTTAKVPGSLFFDHDTYGFNFRMPNLNAALGCGQLEQLDSFIEKKRALAVAYQTFFEDTPYSFITEPEGARSNYWLNAIVCPSEGARDAMLNDAQAEQIMIRPVWRPMHQLPMYGQCIRAELENTEWLASRVVNLPSSVTE